MRQNRPMRQPQPKQSYEKPGVPSWIFLLIFLLVVGVLSFWLASLWQNSQDSKKPPEASKIQLTQPLNGMMKKLAPLFVVPEPVPELLEPEFEELYQRRDSYPDALEETVTMMDNSYFDDAIFFGDSISTGIPLYLEPILPEVAVIAKQGINTSSINTSAVFPVEGVDHTALDAAKLLYGPRNKVYIMLGSNGLLFDEETFLGGYREFIRGVKAQYPGAVIYLQSMTPVTGTPDQEAAYPSLNNPLINQYNLAIMKLAKEEGIHYLDVAVAFLDETGVLPVGASPDGVHVPGEYYYKWFDYLKKHTVGG